MATGPRYRVPYRRRKEGKTNYRLRRALVMSRLPRLVVRGTLKHMIVQVIEAKMYGDAVVVSAHSSELTKRFGWNGGCGNVSASYLTGLLCGFRAVACSVEKCILDLGLQLPSAGARVFAALKGFVDAGVHFRGDIVNVLFNKIDIITVHDINNRAHGGNIYGYLRIKCPKNYEHTKGIKSVSGLSIYKKK